MSPCPACGTKGEHLAVTIPRISTDSIVIVPRCQNALCGVTHWEERAREPLTTILRDWGRHLEV